MPGKRLPLEGYRILDFTWIIAGPLCTKWLAACGAEVIKVESERSRRDQGRAGSGIFANLNTDKRSICLNMQKPKAQEIAHRLVGICDVMINNFAPEIMPRWGLSYEEVRAINPSIITASMPAMGSTGPRSHYKGQGNYFTALMGFDELVGYPQRDVVDVLNWAFADTGPNPFHTATAIAAALLHRNRTGQGQNIELRQYESTINFMGAVVLDAAVNQHQQTRTGSRAAHAAPHGAYACAGDNQWCTITVFTDEAWRSFCAVAGHPEWAADERFRTVLARKAHEDTLDALVTRWTSQHGRHEVLETLQAAGVTAGAVQHAGDLIDKDPQMVARQYYRVMDVPEAGPMAHETLSFRLSETPVGVRERAPMLGEHSEYVLQELLGMSEEDVNACIVEGAVL